MKIKSKKTEIKNKSEKWKWVKKNQKMKNKIKQKKQKNEEFKKWKQTQRKKERKHKPEPWTLKVALRPSGVSLVLGVFLRSTCDVVTTFHVRLCSCMHLEDAADEFGFGVRVTPPLLLFSPLLRKPSSPPPSLHPKKRTGRGEGGAPQTQNPPSPPLPLPVPTPQTPNLFGFGEPLPPTPPLSRSFFFFLVREEEGSEGWGREEGGRGGKEVTTSPNPKPVWGLRCGDGRRGVKGGELPPPLLSPKSSLPSPPPKPKPPLPSKPLSAAACALMVVCVFPPICTTCEFLLCSSEMMLCGLMILGCLTEVPCQTSWPDSPLQIAEANQDLRCCIYFSTIFFCWFFFQNDSTCAEGLSSTQQVSKTDLLFFRFAFYSPLKRITTCFLEAIGYPMHVSFLVMICHCKPLGRIIFCAVVSFSVFVFSADTSCRIIPQVQKDFPLALLLQTSALNHFRRWPWGCERSVFLCSLYNNAVRVFTSVLFLILKFIFLQALFCEGSVKWN